MPWARALAPAQVPGAPGIAVPMGCCHLVMRKQSWPQPGARSVLAQAAAFYRKPHLEPHLPDALLVDPKAEPAPLPCSPNSPSSDALGHAATWWPQTALHLGATHRRWQVQHRSKSPPTGAVTADQCIPQTHTLMSLLATHRGLGAHFQQGVRLS